MGLYYYFGDMGLAQDYPAAAKWLTLAVQHENTPQMAPAANALGAMNEHGFGMPIDRKKAVEWYTKAAESGDPRAQSNLGRIYDEGILIPKDKIQAFMWLKLAADRNDLLASHLLPEYLAGKEFSPAEIQEGKSRADNYETKHHLPHVSTLPLMATPTAPPPASVPAPAAHSNSPPSSSQISKSDGSVPSPSSPVQK